MTAIGAISVKQSNLNKTHDPVLERFPKLLFLSFIDIKAAAESTDDRAL